MVSDGGARHDRVRALDGVRGLAILAVLIFHCSLLLKKPWLIAGSWGWMGVDLFFVVSGFLITGILLDAREAPPRFYYGGFYARRFVRIIPPFALLMSLLVAAPALTGQSTAAHLLVTRHEAWYWAFLTNVLVVIYGWAAVIPQTAPLWSLAVEEQFYLVWPSVVRHVSTRGVLRLGIGLIILAALARIALAKKGVDPVALYVLMPTRADLLAWGAVLAALVRLPNGIQVIRRLLWPTLIGSMLSLIAVVFRVQSSYYWSRGMVIAGYPLIAMCAACLVAIAVIYDPVALRWSWLTGIGKVSYGLYLWHVTAIALLMPLVPRVGAWLMPLALICALVPTLLSWYLVERPALALKRYAPMRPAEVPVEVIAGERLSPGYVGTDG